MNAMPARFLENVLKRSEKCCIEQATRLVESLLETGQELLTELSHHQVAVRIGKEEFEIVIRVALADRRRKNHSL